MAIRGWSSNRYCKWLYHNRECDQNNSGGSSAGNSSGNGTDTGSGNGSDTGSGNGTIGNGSGDGALVTTAETVQTATDQTQFLATVLVENPEMAKSMTGMIT